MSDFDDDPTDIAALHEAVEARDKQAKSKRNTLEADLAWLMSGARGRRVIWYLINTSGAFDGVFNTNAMQMSYNEGRRSVGVALDKWARAKFPTQYIEMIQEAAN